MKKILLLVFSLFLLSGCQRIDYEKKEEEKMYLVLQNESYEIVLENNETVSKLLTLLPISIEMQELNENEKYVYLDTVFPNHPEKIQTIQKGDLMLYQENCLVLFYKNFTTNYSYTKIGHVKNLPDLDQEAITITLK